MCPFVGAPRAPSRPHRTSPGLTRRGPLPGCSRAHAHTPTPSRAGPGSLEGPPSPALGRHHLWAIAALPAPAVASSTHFPPASCGRGWAGPHSKEGLWFWGLHLIPLLGPPPLWALPPHEAHGGTPTHTPVLSLDASGCLYKTAGCHPEGNWLHVYIQREFRHPECRQRVGAGRLS